MSETAGSKFQGLGKKIIHKFTTKDGLLGDYDYAYLFTPKIPFMKGEAKIQPFFSLDSHMPVILALILGLQHALSMLAGVVTPPLIISGVANLPEDVSQYLVSSALIISGILSSIQITRFHIYKTPYYVGTGLLSVVGTSFATITIVSKAIPMMYANGECPVDAEGNSLPCPDGYGAILGTAIVCSLLEIALSFMPAKILQKVFPPIVTGPVVLLIGLSLIESGFKNWIGGSSCVDSICPSESAPHPLPYGSAEFVGLGFLVYVTIIICEKWGSPIMRSCAVICGLLVGCIVAAACNYFDRSGIDAAPVATFIWVHTFKLTIYGPAVLPMLAVFIVLMMEAIGDITATSDVSRLEVEGKLYESRIQGGVLADGLNGMLAGLMTMTPVSTFAQNNGVISITKCANRTAGYCCCFFLIVMGIFSKFAAALVAIPKAVLGGMTTFLFTSVAVSGFCIIATCPLSRRDRFVLTCSLALGFGATLVDTWFSGVFTYSGDNRGLSGFLDAIQLLCETGYAISGIVGVVLNLFIPQEIDDSDHISELEFVLSHNSSSPTDSAGPVEETKKSVEEK
ncbi:nucleobase:cation symporter-2 family protein [Ascoidea rubescens DSM 1968]|uniref:Xanthine/uracil permease n=1 Tax=Ascoidea rubescens DSM 1968 TaxID=1344418 RepID=A0A1D2VBX4_9ASCO|nr:Xanthine/uracil permease [Ascoidea rubescens DSM 1968]ODV58967.1 Xanthine/uracil permease [Ascoidea rubescens DSM 1968]